MVRVFIYFGKGTYCEQAKRSHWANLARIGFSIGAWEEDRGYSQALMVWSICAVMHFYPHMGKEEILNLTQSCISMLLEMIWAIKNPEALEKYKQAKFSSEFEFDQWILGKFR